MLEELRTSLLEVPLLEAALLDDTLLEVPPLELDLPLLEDTLLEDSLELFASLPLLDVALLELFASLPLSEDFAELPEPAFSLLELDLPLLEDTPPTGIHSSSEQV